MSITLTAPATGASWWRLNRHDDPDPADVTEEAEQDDDTPDGEQGDAATRQTSDEPDLDGGDEEDDGDTEDLGDAGKRALARMKAERAKARQEAAAAKKSAAAERRKAAELAAKVAEFEDRDKSELEKAQAKADRSAEQATKAVARAVRSEIKVAATGQFADATDAVDVLMRDPAKYVDPDGEIDTEAIEADLADLLERKPHWAAAAVQRPGAEPETEKPKMRPRPDPGQGSRGTPPQVDFRAASDDEVRVELARYGVRKRY
jgi:multidrug efflux pump subunit AcrA (membrane-fusion protein)